MYFSLLLLILQSDDLMCLTEHNVVYRNQSGGVFHKGARRYVTSSFQSVV